MKDKELIIMAGRADHEEDGGGERIVTDLEIFHVFKSKLLIKRNVLFFCTFQIHFHPPLIRSFVFIIIILYTYDNYL